MEKFLRAGSYSLRPVLTKDQACNALRVLSKTPAVISLIDALGAEAKLHLVGGTVRDIICGQPAVDIDLASALSAEEASRRLNAKNIRVIETGIKHGTVLALSAGVDVEITAFRHPADRNSAIQADTIEEDLGGRDFTINSLAFEISNSRLIDPYGGWQDLNTGIIRCTGDAAQRFAEDPLRLLRMIRFGPCYGRQVDPAASDAAKLLATTLKNVSVERIREEFLRILITPLAADGIRQMLQLNLLGEVVPELLPCVGFEQNQFHIEDVFEHTLTVLMRCPQDETLRLCAIFHDLGKPATLSVGDDGARHFYLHEVKSTELCKEIMQRMRFSQDDTRKVASIVRHHMRPIDCGPSGLRRLMRDLGDELEAWRQFKIADAPPVMSEEEFNSTLREFDEMLRNERDRLKGAPYGKLAIDGHDLIALGVQPGEYLGQLLSRLEELVLDDPALNTKETLTERARKLISAK